MTTQVDWPRLLDDLRWLLGEPDFAFPDARTPLAKPKLAIQLGMSWGAMRNLFDGTEPRHTQGEALIAMWCRLSGKGREFVPICRVSFTAAQMRR